MATAGVRLVLHGVDFFGWCYRWPGGGGPTWAGVTILSR